MKRICPVCSKNKSQRSCKLKDGEQICFLCCIEIRKEECIGCTYYKDAKSRASEKPDKDEKQKEKQRTIEKYFQKLKEKQKEKKGEPHFFKRIAPEVDSAVNAALGYAQKGNYLEAEKMLSELLIDNSDHDSVYFGFGALYSLQERYDEALVSFDTATRIFPYHVEAWFNKGMVYKQKLEIEQMIECYQKVVKYGDMEDYYVVEAKEMLENVVKTSGLTLNEFLHSAKIFKKGFDYMNIGECEKAIHKFKEVLEMDSRHTQSYGNMGICYGKMGNKQKALEALDKAIEIDPEYKPAIDNRRIISKLEDGESLKIPSIVIKYSRDKKDE